MIFFYFYKLEKSVEILEESGIVGMNALYKT